MLLLELGAFLIQRNIESTNPYIVAFNQSGNPSQAGDAAITELDADCPEVLAGWETTPVGDAAMPGMVERAAATPFEDAMRMDLRVRFGMVSPEIREVYTRMCGEVVLLADAAFDIREIYGNDKSGGSGVQGMVFRFLLWKSGQLAEICRAIARVLQTGDPQSYTMYLPGPDAPNEKHQMLILPSPEQGWVYVFLDAHPERIYAPPIPQPAVDSRWDVPFFRYKKNFCPEQDPSFCTNSLGFRSPEIEIPKPEGVFRVLCIGGSTTDDIWADRMTFPALLQMRLQQQFPERTIEVVNAGTPGIESQGHLLRLEDYLRIEPDMVVAHIGVNDTIKLYDTLPANLPPRVSRFIQLFFPAILAPSPGRFKESLHSSMGMNLRLLCRRFQHSGCAVVFASMPYPDPHLLTADQRRYMDYRGRQAWALPSFSLERYAAYIDISNALLRRVAHEMGAVYIPLAESMAAATNVYNDFCHMSQAGIHAKAHIIGNAIIPLITQEEDMRHTAPNLP